MNLGNFLIYLMDTMEIEIAYHLKINVLKLGGFGRRKKHGLQKYFGCYNRAETNNEKFS
ncbi:hypothetical protein BSG1_09453 [Bacillus sp. SG-1]|nr:hypothetical protein BSG1_09453 [Bacillus sp. SG-1]